jgi:hypothetical protein
VRAKTVLTEIGQVEIEVPRDLDASFRPKIVKKRQRRLTGVDQIVLSLSARGLTTGEISAPFAEVYGASVSRETVCKITDSVLEEMTAWMNRPLDEVYPVIFIDAIVVKVRDGQVRNKPINVYPDNMITDQIRSTVYLMDPCRLAALSPAPRWPQRQGWPSSWPGHVKGAGRGWSESAPEGARAVGGDDRWG